MGAPVLGAFRGVCVDSADPRRLGRIRVLVPQVLGAQVSGWAFPAWSMHDLSIWPEDRLPQPGQGVWLMFEHQDRMVWLAAFGPPLLSDQRFDDILDDLGRSVAYETSLTWSLPVMPTEIPVPITGVLFSPSGVPQPEAEVRVERSATENGTYESIGTVPVDPVSGAWSLDYARPSGEDGWWYRAVFDGSDPFWAAQVGPEQEVVPEKTSALAWSGTADLVWRRTKTVTGTLTSAEDNGRGIEGRVVGIYGRAQGATAWTLLAESDPVELDGTWTAQWFWPEEMVGATDVRALYLGDSGYDFSETASEQIGPVALQVDVQWELPTDPVLDATYSTAGSATVPKWDDAAPDPPEILLERREPSGSANAWTLHARVALTANGSFTYEYTFDAPHADHRARYPAVTGFAEGKSEEMARVISLLTTVSVPQVPAAQVGQQVTVQATVRDETLELAPSGTAHLEVFAPSGGDFAVYGSVEVSNGNAAIPWTPTEPGEHRLRISYDGTAALLPSVSPEAISNPVVGVPLLTEGQVTNTSAGFTWNSVSGADEYEVQKGSTTVTTTNLLGYTAGSLANYTQYSFRVRAIAAGIPGAWSSTITCRTGRPEVRSTGSFWHYEYPTISGTYRPSEGDWTYNGDWMVHGYYNTASRSGHGVCNYNGQGFRDWVDATYGSTVRTKLVYEQFKLNIIRETGAGHNGKTIVLYVTNAIPHASGQPLYAGGLVLNRAEIDAVGPLGEWDLGETVEVVIPKAWAHWAAHVLENHTTVSGVSPNPVRGWLIRQDSSANYAKYYGTNNGNGFRLNVNCSWDFQTQSPQNGVWL